jgi:hypothetical protein
MVKHREITKVEAIEVTAFVLRLQIEKMEIEKGRASYRKLLPDDANYFERYANQMALRKRGIHQQAVEQFGYNNTKKVQRALRIVERDGLYREVVDKYERDLAVENVEAARRQRLKTPEDVKFILGVMSLGG